MQRRPLIAGNWKMHGTLDSARSLSVGVASGSGDLSCDLAVCPPYPHLFVVAEALRGSKVALGGQNLAREEPGAYTGETAGEMLVDVGATLVLVGHSERRAYYAEDDVVVSAKVARALALGLTPILCVGETLEQRESGSTSKVVEAQLGAVIDHVGVNALAACVLAYEPVWAIGTGKTATPEQANDVHVLLRARVARDDADVAAGLRILYGGSVKADNAASLLSMSDIDGGLIGGASLKAEEFLGICRAAS